MKIKDGFEYDKKSLQAVELFNRRVKIFKQLFLMYNHLCENEDAKLINNIPIPSMINVIKKRLDTLDVSVCKEVSYLNQLINILLNQVTGTKNNPIVLDDKVVLYNITDIKAYHINPKDSPVCLSLLTIISDLNTYLNTYNVAVDEQDEALMALLLSLSF